jgi:hypothetical protein
LSKNKRDEFLKLIDQLNLLGDWFINYWSSLVKWIRAFPAGSGAAG